MGNTKSICLLAGLSLALAACGGGGEDGEVVASDPTTPSAIPSPSPSPSPQPAPAPAPEPVSDSAQLDLSKPFSQAITCYFGLKPYYEEPLNWQVSFDGDQLTLQSLRTSRQLGGRFSTSGNAIERENYAGSALQRTYIGATGGEIWFVKALNGQIISTGHNNFGNGSTGTSVECGDSFTSQWVAAPESTPFTIDFADQRVTWVAGFIPAACRQEIREQGVLTSTELSQGDLELTAEASIVFRTSDGNSFVLAGHNAQVQQFQFTRHGGGSLYYETGSDGRPFRQSLQLDGQSRLRRISSFGGAGRASLFTCVPDGLEP